MSPGEVVDTELVVVVVLAVLGFWSVGAYNRLVRLRNAASSAWRTVDELLVARVQLVDQLALPLRESHPQDRDVIEAALAAARQTASACAAARERPLVARHLHGVSLALQVLHTSIAALSARLANRPSESAPPEPPMEDGATAAADAPGVAPATAADTTAQFEELAAQAARLDFAAQQFNAAVVSYNAAALQIPTRVVATLFGLRPARTLENTRREGANA